MTLVLELILGYLAASTVVTFALVRFFRRTEVKAVTASVVEFRPRGAQDIRAGGDSGTTQGQKAA